MATSTLAERCDAHEAAIELAGMIEQLGYALRDKEEFAGNEGGVQVTFTDGPTHHYLAQSRPGINTTRFLTKLIRDAIPGVIDARLDAGEGRS